MERPIDLMSVLRQEVDALVALWTAEHGRAPRGIVFPFAKYALLEDYCRDREVQALLKAMTAVASAPLDEKAQRLRERTEAQRRLDQLRHSGVRFFTSNAGDLRITVDRSATDFRFL